MDKNKKQGILFIIGAGFCFALMTFFVRMAGDLPTIQKAFFRNVVAVFVAFVREWAGPDVIALTALGALLATGSLGEKDFLALFSNSAPITIGAMFVLSAALERTGVVLPFRPVR